MVEATFLHRLKAFSIDYILILAYLGLLFVTVQYVVPSVQQLFTQSLAVAQLAGFLLVTVPVSIYFIVCDSTVRKQSVGKKVSGIQVVNRHGRPLSVRQAVVRTFLKFVPWEMSHFLVYRLVLAGEQEMPVYVYAVAVFIYGLIFAYILTCAFSKRKQSVYDMLADTYVVKVT
jgi:uncharacterized RDD family membrane protein YckC